MWFHAKASPFSRIAAIIQRWDASVRGGCSEISVAISRRQERWVLWLGLQIPEQTGGHGSKLTYDHQQNNGVTTTIVITEQLIGDSPFKPHYWAELPFFAALALDLP